MDPRSHRRMVRKRRMMGVLANINSFYFDNTRLILQIFLKHGLFYKLTQITKTPLYTILNPNLIFVVHFRIMLHVRSSESTKANAMKISRRTNSDFDACNNSYVLVWHHQIPKSQNKKICHIQQIRYASIRSRAKIF